MLAFLCSLLCTLRRAHQAAAPATSFVVSGSARFEIQPERRKRGRPKSTPPLADAEGSGALAPRASPRRRGGREAKESEEEPSLCAVLEERLGMGVEERGALLEQWPDLAAASVPEQIAPALAALLKLCGESKEAARAAVAALPRLLLHSAPDLLARAALFDAHGVAPEEFLRLAARQPRVLKTSRSILASRLRVFHEAGFREGSWELRGKLAALAAAGPSSPTSCGACCCVPARALPQRPPRRRAGGGGCAGGGGGGGAAREAVLRDPALLTARGGADALRARLALLEAQGIAPDDARTILRREPAILRLSKENLSRKIDFLHGLGLDDEGLARLLRAAPRVLVASLDALEARRRFLRARDAGGLGLSRPALLALLRGAPTVLLADVETNLRPKAAFLREMGASRADLLRFPAYFTRSLRARILPRVLYLRHRGRRLPGLSRLFGTTDAVFARTPAEAAKAPDAAEAAEDAAL
eukprot:tig00001537_g9303.t1